MDHQTTLDGRSHRDGTPRLARRLAAVAGDVATIAELQLRLIAADLRAATNSAARGVALVGLAAVLLLSALPLLLLALATALIEMAGWPAPWALLAVAMTTIAGALGAAWLAWNVVRSQRPMFRRSAAEFRANIAAIRGILAEKSGGESL